MTAESDDGATYPMRVAERLSGVSAATIRAWERRYGAVAPERTEGNARRYSAKQVRRLTLLRRATERGHSIAQIAELDEAALEALDDDSGEAFDGAVGETSAIVTDYLAAIARFEPQRALDILGRAATLLSPRALVLDLIIPLVREVSERWETGELAVAEEHLVTAQLRWLLFTVLRHAVPITGAPRILLATVPGERHELGALIGAFIAATRGFSPIFLGTDLPFEEIEEARERSGARLVVLSVVTTRPGSEVRGLVRGIAGLAKGAQVWVGVDATHPLAAEKLSARVLTSYADFDDALVAYRRG